MVVTFGPDGATGHPDHVRIGAAADAAFLQVRCDGGRGLRRLLHGAIPQSWFDRMQAWRVAHGFPPWQPENVYHLRAVPDRCIGVHVRIDPVAHVVVAVLLEHRSQRLVLVPTEVDQATFTRGLRPEWHTVVWPPRHEGEPLLADLFEGLDDGNA
ncbi:hypothetical protein [Cellulomonas marina]|uniref:Uncharacterized protein n=1 Tax=Cellulomonas marina TaxID=988821 RepID=A0A1I0W449_9CELL|nr:hypothetical protein [Cellulomonas marina]GIG29961.1 hypothetical protein Cma02nite_25610 [Cellulomonas marina]SFA83117.1 hypothetical protein SAMN05421867_102144 [Cellulomonas marina]